MLSPLITRHTRRTRRGRPVHVLDERLAWHAFLSVDDRDLWNRIAVVVPAGFATDLASTPRVLWRLFPPDGPWTPAAVIHDYLYSRASRCPRALADAVFLAVMAELQVPRVTRWLLYAAVRLFGRRAFAGKQATDRDCDGRP